MPEDKPLLPAELSKAREQLDALLRIRLLSLAEAEHWLHANAEQVSEELRRIAQNIVGPCREGAVDLAQEMALRALEAKPPPPDVLSDKSRLRGWWYRVGRRLAIDAARATKRSVAALDTDEPSNPEVRNSLVVDGDPSGQLERAQFLALVLSTARRLLKEPERVALHLRYSEARSDAEIAQLVGGTAKGINSRINRALKKLRQRFAEADIQPA